MEQNPYPNEHAVRVTDPDPKRYIRIRRQNDKFGEGIHALWGVLRKKIGNMKTELQAVRFDAKKFTPAMVRKWVDSHGGRGFKIEAATDYSKVGEVYQGNPMEDKITKKILSATADEMQSGKLVIYGETIMARAYHPQYEELIVHVLTKDNLHTKAMRLSEFIRKFSKKTRSNPMDSQGVAAWLEAAYFDEKKGISEYEKLYKRIEGVPDYAPLRKTLKRIIKDEKRHMNTLSRILGF